MPLSNNNSNNNKEQNKLTNYMNLHMEYSRNKSANDPISPEKFSNNNKNINSAED